MATTTPQMGFTKWSGSDDFDPDELADNWDAADAAPGVFRCTSGTRPASWTSAQEGRLIFETDTELHWRWNGSAFERVFPVGLLNSGERTSDLITTGSFAVVTQAAVTVPTGGRDIEVSVTWGNPTATVHLALYRGGVMLAEWNAAANCSGGKTIVDAAPAAGAQTYSLQAKNDGSAATLTGSATIKSTVAVKEV